MLGGEMVKSTNDEKLWRKECGGFVLMLEPKEGCTHKAASTLAMCSGVSRVDIMTGSCAIMVHGKDTIALNKVIVQARKFGDASNFAIRRIAYKKV